ncbi:efflux RND transporter permease subunit [Paenibacillus melissococcoides]|uniref:Efflux RND transporter permease subunit n=1 Tax=Paenibacillus melissococcoides TaxID=2912268 RepID=A0ABN8U6D7_9BACL|nr:MULTISPECIES: efflux RND transporter permease subunit [Paenibacillus]MEB9892308.1 efflux RND transporter permease subunit [Bacillus cereus]CAH8246683.1 efflux RND transporter permease subunit [Paenibacillus melissococcoides]CAH8715438.1 efflux RND transporter permease subunit [Paenibacillus melissococcoides]CAH8716401.1 efflux RND transporter permease subunit [Paenibacillus melissococcoides]GIO80266.1 multidrug ABC transporter [Paenibacillus dendritiformis]
MKIIDVSVKRPIGVMMVVLAIIALGLVSLRNLAIDLFPKIDLPIAVVATSYQGAAPEEIEKLISRPIEASLSTIQGIDTVSSQSQANSSLVMLQFKTGTNMDNALIDVREKVDQIKGMLPEDATDPSVLRFDPNQMPIITLGLTGASPEKLQEIADTNIIPFLERENGVASVSVAGGKTREILVELNRANLARYGIGTSQVVQAINAENKSAVAGSVPKGVQDVQIRVKGEYTSVEDIGRTLIHLPGGGQIQVSDIADINDTFKKQSSLTLVDGAQALVLSVQRQSDANTVAVADNVDKAVSRLQQDLPQGIELKKVSDTSIFIRQSIDSVVSNMLSGGLLAVFILILFLRSIRSTFVIALSMPIAIISTFTLMYFTGQTLNIISMGGLALGIGMMVDNSIVILENIFTYRQKGMSMKEAAIKGAAELASAVIASTMTTLVVFLPIVFVQGLTSDIFRPLALTVCFSLIASLVVAITLIPMLSSKIVSQKKIVQSEKKGWYVRFFGLFVSGYKRILRWALGHRKTTVFATILLLVGSFFLFPFIGMEFMPGGDQGQIQISVQTPSGTSLEETKKVADEVAALLKPYESIIDTASESIGGGGPFGGGANSATFTIQLIRATERDMTTTAMMQELTDAVTDIPGAEITVSAMESGFGAGSPIQIKLNGQEQDVLEEVASQVVWLISDIHGVYNAESSAAEGNAELNISIDRSLAATYGLSYQQIMNEISLAMNGQLATQYREGGSEYDVRVILPEAERDSISALNALTIQSQTGQLVPLSAVAQFQQLQGPVMIQRENQQRQINVTADLAGRDLGSVSTEIEQALQKMNFSEGYTYSMGGETEEMMSAFADLAIALVFSIFLVYVVMAVQFESLLYPFIIMFAMPTTFVGVLFGLFITGTPLSVTALIGVIMLAGIVVNNAIILVDYINIQRRYGLERHEAIMQGAPSRLRPIFMTTLTTVLGLLPLALGIGEGAEMQAPLAIVVIFGLSCSTIFTLLLVPVMYTYLDDFSNWIKRLFTRKNKSETAHEAAV